MPSPFPGMDPFLEDQEWEDFHTTFNTVAREQLGAKLRPDYLVRVEKRVYREHPGTAPESMRVADIAIVTDDPGLPSGRTSEGSATRPRACTLPMPQERRETYLVVRERESMKVATIIELLSPANKRNGGDGRREYLSKREQIHASPTVIDMARGGDQILAAIILFPDLRELSVARSVSLTAGLCCRLGFAHADAT